MLPQKLIQLGLYGFNQPGNSNGSVNIGQRIVRHFMCDAIG
jgi:hypothetical protein